jgi:hypothetical protein
VTSKQPRSAVRLDVLGLLLAGMINTFLAPFVAGIVLSPGTPAGQPDLMLRARWINGHTLRWQGGWFFWFPVTLSFAWSYLALGRHLDSVLPWPVLATGVAVIAAAVDLVGVLINISVVPELARALANEPVGSEPVMVTMFRSVEGLAYALTNVAAFGLYAFAGLLLLPTVFTTAGYPRWLAYLGVMEWSVSSLATALLVVAPVAAMVPLLIGFALYAPWVWGSAWWLLRGRQGGSAVAEDGAET